MHFSSPTSPLKISRRLKAELGAEIRRMRCNESGEPIIELQKLGELTGIDHRTLSQMELGQSILEASALSRVLKELHVPEERAGAILQLRQRAWDATPVNHRPHAKA